MECASSNVIANRNRLEHGTRRAAYGFRPAKVLRINPPMSRDLQARPFDVEEVTEDGRAVPTAALPLPPGQHPLEIRFTALEFKSPEKLRSAIG